MSQTARLGQNQGVALQVEPGENINHYPPNTTQPVQGQNTQGESNFSDGSDPLFSMYLDRAVEEDRRMAESWKGDADGILVFTGLFSAAVAALIAVSIQGVSPSSQDDSVFYLANIYKLLHPNGSQITIPSRLSDPSSKFTPPTSAVLVNTFWFLSLAISLTCALLATLLQQWSRRYLRVTNPRYSPHKRARIRAFYANGVHRLQLPMTVEALPTLLHLSLFLFFAGLSVFLHGINLTIFRVVIVWVGLCVIMYACLTFLPLFHKDSPYYAPLSSSVSFCVTGLRYGLFSLLERITCFDPYVFGLNRGPDSRAVHQDNFSHSARKNAETFALELPPAIDYEALLWTFDSLDDDIELENFFEGVPRFCASEAVKNPLGGFIIQNTRRLSEALIGLMDRTLSSFLLPDAVKIRRIIICSKAVDATGTHLFGPWFFLRRVLLGDWHGFLRSVEFGIFVQNWSGISHKAAKFYAQCAVSVIISSVQEHDERWFKLAGDQLNVSKSVLRSYLAPGDSVLLANLIHVVRQTTQAFFSLPEHENDVIEASSKTLESACKFDAQKALPTLQHEFCSLWNQLNEAAQTNEHRHSHTKRLAMATLKNIRKVYFTLHEGTAASPTAFTASSLDDQDSVLDDISSYPMCTVKEHHSLPILTSLLDEADAIAAENASSAVTPGTPHNPFPTVSMTFPQPFLSHPSALASPLPAQPHHSANHMLSVPHSGPVPAFPVPQTTSAALGPNVFANTAWP